MRDLIVIPKAAALSLDSAAAFLRTPFPDADWLSIDHGDAPGAPRRAAPPPGPGAPDGLAWLFGHAPRPCEVHPEGLREAIGGLERDGIIYRCRCSPTRLQELAAAALASGREPRYDGRCRSEPTASPIASAPPFPADTRWRLREGDPRDRDRPVDTILGVAVLLGEGTWSRLVVPWDLEASGRRVLRLAEALGAGAVSLEVGPAVVGPDGSPLWRSQSPSRVADLARAGYEPTGVRRFLGDAAGGPSVFFSLGGLAEANRACILEMPEASRLPRLAEELRGAGIGCPDDDEGRRRYWDATVGRLYRYGDAARHLAFLGGSWTPAPIPERDRAQVARVGEVVLEMRPRDGGGLLEVLKTLSRREDEIHDLRRVLRWAITGQEVAPPLTVVWDLLGADRALERLSNALAQIR